MAQNDSRSIPEDNNDEFCLTPHLKEKLTDMKWRDDNLDLLPSWHPAFFEIFPDLRNLLIQYADVMVKYKRILLSTCSDPIDELQNHVHEEASLWLMNRMDDLVREVWNDDSVESSY
jgi:hypothetical protein